MSGSDEKIISVPLVTADAFRRPGNIEFTAGDTELSKIAENYGLEAVSSFRFEGHSEPVSKIRLRIRGTLTAGITQTCVATLESVDEEIQEEVDLLFTNRPPKKSDEEPEVDIDMELSDPPEFVGGAVFDIGDFILEHFALAVPPYPRKSGVEYVERIEDTDKGDDAREASPFAVLKTIRSE